MKPLLLHNIITYLKNPEHPELHQKHQFFYSLWQITRINLLSVLLAFVIGIFISFINTKTNALEGHAVGDFIENESALASFVFACVIAPLFEETAFRLWLVNKPLQIALGIFGFSFFYFSSLIPGSFVKSLLSLSQKYNLFTLFAFYITCFVLSIATIYSIIKLRPIQSKLDYLYQNKYGWIFYGSSFLFGLLHISNYKLSWTVILLTPVLVLPQILGGVLLSYIRVKYGFWRGVLGHFIYNLLLLAPILALKLMTESGQKLIQNKDFEFSQLASNDQTIVGVAVFYFLFLVCAVLVSNIQLLAVYVRDKKKSKIQNIL